MNLPLLIIFNLATLCFTLETIELSDDIEYPLTSTKATQTHIHMANGFKLHVTVDKINTKAASKDFLLVKPGENLEDGEGSGFVFTYDLKEPRSFIVFSSDVVIIFEVNDPGEFSLKYKRVGEAILTTTENPISTSTWPQPGPEDSVYLNVYVDGLHVDEYRNETVLEDFKTAVGYMANQYVADNSQILPVISNITAANVLISRINRCNYNWPDSDNCVEVRFAVPVVLNKTLTNDTYQLTTKHLTLLWERYADKYLKGGTCRYFTPDLDEAVTSWGLTLGLLIFFLLIGIGAIVIIRDKIIHYINVKRRSSSIIDILDYEHRDSNMSLNPPPMQMFPQLFEQEQTVPEPVWLRGQAAEIAEDPDDDDIHFDSQTLNNNTTTHTYTLNHNGNENDAFETDT